MTRTVDRAKRAELLERIAGYVLERGIAELSLRPMAKAVGLSPRTLLYHFGSKEAIVAAVLGRFRERQLLAFDELRRSQPSTPGAVCRTAWAYMSAPEMLPLLRLFFEAYALALRDPGRFPGFLESAVEDWLAFFSDPLCSRGMERAHARSVASVVLAGYRGFMLDFAATQDRERIRAALELWADALDGRFCQEDPGHAQPA